MLIFLGISSRFGVVTGVARRTFHILYFIKILESFQIKALVTDQFN